MIHAFLLVLVIGGVIQEEQPMYFRGIETCNWYASKLSKRYGNYYYLQNVPREHKVTAYCKPAHINKDTKGLYEQ